MKVQSLNHREYAGKDHRLHTSRQKKLRAMVGASRCKPGGSRWEQTRGVEGEAADGQDQGQQKSRTGWRDGAGALEEHLRHLCG